MVANIYLATADNSALAAELLADGRVLILPTDTLYCLAADMTNSDAVNSVYLLKQRPANKFMPMLVSDRAMADRYTTANERERLLQDAFWPGAVTLILQTRPQLELAPNSYNGVEVAVRVPQCPFIAATLNCLQRPITGTSANITMGKNLLTKSELQQQFGNDVAAVFMADWPLTGAPSSILKVVNDQVLKIRG